MCWNRSDEHGGAIERMAMTETKESWNEISKSAAGEKMRINKAARERVFHKSSCLSIIIEMR